MANITNVRFPHHKLQKYNINTPGTTIQQSISNDSDIVTKKIYYQQKSTKNNTTCMNDVKSNSFLPSRNSQITSKHVINSSNSPLQKKKKNSKSSLKIISKDSKQFNKHLKPLQDVSTTSQILSYALKNEVSAGLPHISKQPTLHDVQEQSDVRRLSFESSGFSCCKSFSTKSDDPEVSKVFQCYVIKLPGMLHSTHVPKCIVEKNDHEDVIHAFPILKVHIDHQLVRVKLPGMQNSSVTLCDEPWWLSPKETSVPSQLVVKQERQEEENVETLKGQQEVIVIEEEKVLELKDDDVVDDDVNEEYESARAIEFQFSVNPIVNLPCWKGSKNVKRCQKKEMVDYYYLDNYFHVTTSAGIEFDDELPIVRLCPKPTIPSPNPRSDLPNLRIETNLNDDGYFKSVPGSTVSTPISEVSSSFSHISTYAESENTVFTEEDEIKSCNAPERRSPSVLSDFGSEQLTPVLEEEEEDSKLISSKFLSIEECREEYQECREECQEEHQEECQEEHQEECQEHQEECQEHQEECQEHQEECQEEFQEECQDEFQEECQEEFQEEIIIDESQQQDIPETNTYSYSESENEDSEYQEIQDPQDNEYVLPELKIIAEQLDDSKESIKVRRQLEIISNDNYPGNLPLSNVWTMYFADTSVTKTNTRIISKNKYSSTLNPVFECTTVPELCSNLRKFSSKIKPSDMKTNANLSFFKGNIMPMWEDEANQKGGRFTICPPRYQLNSLWDSIVLLLAGEMIDDNDLICGAVCARRDRGDRVELWISGDAYSKDIERIRDLLSAELGSDMFNMIRNVKYKKHLGKP